MAEKSSWDQANILQKLGLVWRNRKTISQIIKEYPLNYFMKSLLQQTHATPWVGACAFYSAEPIFD
jgi:hypothetical protein